MFKFNKQQEVTTEEKQSELQRCRAIVLTTLDYLEKCFGGSFVYDEYDPITEHYQQQKLQTEKYFEQGRLNKLQQRLARLTEEMPIRDTLTFTEYIKEETGHDIDIFEALQKRVAIIITQNEIRTQKDLNDVRKTISFYQETRADAKELETLKTLLTNYSKKTSDISRKRNEYTEFINRVETDGIEEVTLRISTGPKSKHFEEQVATSPDGKCKLYVVQWSDGKNASTSVTVQFPTASGAVYAVSAICPEVKAWWKNNVIMVIETKSTYKANTKCKQVRSFDKVIAIEYIER